MLDLPVYRKYHSSISLIDDTPVSFNSGYVFPAGVYRIRYDGGALAYHQTTAPYSYQVNYEITITPPPTPYDPEIVVQQGFKIRLNSDPDLIYNCPGDYDEYLDSEECETENLNTNPTEQERSSYVDVIHPGGIIEVFLDLDDYSDIVTAPCGIPRFSISKVYDNKLSSSPIVYDFACSNTEYTFYGSNRNLYFNMYRRHGLIKDTLSNWLTVTYRVPAANQDKTFNVYYAGSLIAGPTVVTAGSTEVITLTDLTGNDNYDYLEIRVSNSPFEGTLDNEYSIQITEPQVDSTINKAILVSPGNGSLDLNPLRVDIEWSEDSLPLEPILGWDVYLNGIYVKEISDTDSFFEDLDINTLYEWSIIPWTISRWKIDYSSFLPDTWEFTTGEIQADGFCRDTRVIDQATPIEMNVTLRWSMFSIYSNRLSVPPEPPIPEGTRYFIDPTASGVWIGHESQYATWNGLDWDYSDPDLSLFDNIIKYSIFYRLRPREIANYDWTFIKTIDADSSLEYTETIDMLDVLTSSYRAELSKIFTRWDDNLLEFKIIAYIQGSVKNESCGIMLPHSIRQLSIQDPNPYRINHYSTKRQLYINLDGDGKIGRTLPAGVGNNEYQDFHVFSEYDLVFHSSNAPGNLGNPSRIAVDFNRRQTNRAPTIWTAFRGDYGYENGLIQYDYYTGDEIKYWVEGSGDEHDCNHGGGSRSITINYDTGDGICGGTGRNMMQRHISSGAQAAAVDYVTAGQTYSYYYGGVVDQYGTVWTVRRYGGTLSKGVNSVNINGYGRAYSDATTPAFPYYTYNITADHFGGIWLSGWNKEATPEQPPGILFRFVPNSDGTIESGSLQTISLESSGVYAYNIGGICSGLPIGNQFSIWGCEFSEQKVFRATFNINTTTNRVTLSSVAQTGHMSSFQPHGIAVDSDGNIWVASVGSYGCYKIYQKQSGTDWGNGLDTQGGDCVYPDDVNHSVYDQWDAGTYTGTGQPAYTGMTYRAIAYDLLHGQKLYPYYSGASTWTGIGKYKFFSSGPLTYIYSDFTGQVMKSANVQNPVADVQINYSPVYSRVM